LRTFLLVVCLLAAAAPSASAQSTITLAWDPSPVTDVAVAGYVLSWGTESGQMASTMDVGIGTEWTVSGLEAYRKYYFTVRAYDSKRNFSAAANVVSNNGVIIQSSQATVDDRPSLFWHNGTTGELLTWHLAGETVVDTRPISIPSVDTSWKVAGTGDLNGDGFSDMLFRHADGWLAMWCLQNNQVICTDYLSINRMADENWRIAGVGDTNGDRHADVVWQHADGWLAVWLMRGSTVLSTQFLSIPRMPDPRWRIAAVGDLNSDGRADLVWQSTDGWLATWLLQGTTVTLTQYFSIYRMTDPLWQIVAAGSIGASSPPAVVWRHSSTGSVALWQMKGATVMSTIRPKPDRVANLEWTIVGGR
jgi:hypothetical protein